MQLVLDKLSKRGE